MNELDDQTEMVSLVEGDTKDLEKWSGYLKVAGISNDIRMTSGSPGS